MTKPRIVWFRRDLRLSDQAAVIAAAAVFGKSWYTLAVVCMTLLLLWRHRANIMRLRAGTESRIRLVGSRRAPPSGDGGQ